MQTFTRAAHYKTFEWLCFITGIEVTSEHLEARNPVVTFLMFKKLDLQPCRRITNSGCQVGEITSSVIADLAYKGEICLILVCPEVLGWEKTRVMKSSPKNLQRPPCWLQFASVHLFCAYGYLMLLTEAPATCDIQGHMGFYIMPVSRSKKAKVECKNSGISLLFQPPQCKHSAAPQSSAQLRGHLEPTALKSL